MKVKDMRNLIKDLDDEVDIEVNSVWNEEKQELFAIDIIDNMQLCL